ncbi:helix-turn-helix domain-containing protein [Rhizobium multihospitium]|uniref:Transcriptional regulator, contains XRE-family HTH domain n=1 Tax=Rhizobium multihospitium TaxID=410764 RepID=A0A1C3XB05_9HYPH|nr:Transcriptional regulator, contains XRE-family HTH domain [Rhizobium multihospitium]
MKREIKQPSSIDVRIGEQVRRARMMLGWSQSKLARTIGVSFQQIQKYETGATRLTASRVLSLAEILNVSISFLLQPVRQSDSHVRPDQDPQSGELITAFMTIDDPHVRMKVVELLEAVAVNYIPSTQVDS